MERLEEYLEGKNLNLNTEKIVRFRKGGGRMDRRDWRWKRRKIEEAKEFKYLGYILQRNGGQEALVRGKSEESGGDNGTDMRNWKEEI